MKSGHTYAQQWQTYLRMIGLKSSAVKGFMRIQSVNDLNSNCVICQLAGLSRKALMHAGKLVFA
jgi:hypothetical protein